MNPIIHNNTEILTKSIGANTRISEFCVVLEKVVIGTDCNVCSHCSIANDVIVGDRVTIDCGARLSEGLRIENDVYIGSNVTFTDHKAGQLGQSPETVVKVSASIGANATIFPGFTIGAGAIVGAGSVVTQDAPAGAIVMGNPANIIN